LLLYSLHFIYFTLHSNPQLGKLIADAIRKTISYGIKSQAAIENQLKYEKWNARVFSAIEIKFNQIEPSTRN